MKKGIILLIVVLAAAQWWFKSPTIGVASNDVRFTYMVKYTGTAAKNDTLPLLIALHGNSDTPKNFFNTALDEFSARLRIILIQGPVSRARGSAWPWTADEFSQYGAAFSEAVTALSAKFPTQGQPVLLGFSGGGMMAYYQAIKHGDQYASIFPISGQLSHEMLGEGSASKGAKVFAYHGKNDSVVSIGGARTAIDILRKNGIYADLHEFKGGHHGIFNDMKTSITHAVEQSIRN